MADRLLLRPHQAVVQNALFFAVISRVRELPVVRPVLNAVAGYQRPFSTFADAAAAIAGDEGGGHAIGRFLADRGTGAPGRRDVLPGPVGAGLLRPVPSSQRAWELLRKDAKTAPPHLRRAPEPRTIFSFKAKFFFVAMPSAIFESPVGLSAGQWLPCAWSGAYMNYRAAA